MLLTLTFICAKISNVVFEKEQLKKLSLKIQLKKLKKLLTLIFLNDNINAVVPLKTQPSNIRKKILLFYISYDILLNALLSARDIDL